MSSLLKQKQNMFRWLKTKQKHVQMAINKKKHVQMAKNDNFQLLNLIESGDFEEACRRILEARLMLYLYDIQPVTKADKFYSDDAPDELRQKLSRIQVEQLEQGGYSDQVMTVVVTEETISQVVKALLARLPACLADNYFVLRVCTLHRVHQKDNINLDRRFTNQCRRSSLRLR